MSLKDWYNGSEILIVGVTSELGRNLLEKLLRVFSNLKIYVILRMKAGIHRDDRLKTIFESPGYQRLRQEKPNSISRVKSIEGNLVCSNLGIRNNELSIFNNVSIAFHVGGPNENFLKFCNENLPNLKSIVMVESLLKNKNEKIVREMLPNDIELTKIPLALVRIPILGPASHEPIPGYVEIIRGPLAIITGAGHALAIPDEIAEFVPVDIASNIIISAAWERATRNTADLAIVYNTPPFGCTWNELAEKSKRAHRKFPYPTFSFPGITSSASLHWFLVFLFEWMPSAITDIICYLFGQKQKYLAEHKKIQDIIKMLEPISLKLWSIERKNVDYLYKKLSPQDQESFPVRADIDTETYAVCAAAAARKYCVYENNLKFFKFFIPTFFTLFIIATGYYCIC